MALGSLMGWSGAVLEAPGLVSGLDDLAMMGETGRTALDPGQRDLLDRIEADRAEPDRFGDGKRDERIL
jgi:hypothetical protein